MSLRITTWNVNGIRNPFAFHPWCDQKSFQAMFDILEADIVCIQELKIQKKDLRDDMVLVPGWDCFCTFPKHKKGYSGVAIYTRQSKCNPIKAEEGLTGILEPPNSAAKSYLALPESEAIGGYPDLLREEAILLDSEGRCLVLDFGAFVLIGLYCPAQTDPARDEFRIAFAAALNQRIRNLVEVKKRRVVVVGDLNIARDEIDSAHAKEIMTVCGLEDYKDTPNRKMLHKLLEPHETGVMVDLCREFFPNRRGMYTCWETAKNARPGNFGQRIDYILCSSDMRGWFRKANIQEGLMGSDHCPVYGVIGEKVTVEGHEKYILDLVNPPGLFVDGKRQLSQTAPQLKLSAKISGEYAGRQSIRDMFLKVSAQSISTPKGPKSPSHAHPDSEAKTLNRHSSTEIQRATYTTTHSPSAKEPRGFSTTDAIMDGSTSEVSDLAVTYSTSTQSREPPAKKQKTSSFPMKKLSTAVQRKTPSRGQQNLMGFLQKPSPTPESLGSPSSEPSLSQQSTQSRSTFTDSNDFSQLDVDSSFPSTPDEPLQVEDSVSAETGDIIAQQLSGEGSFPSINPIVAKEKWSQLFTKPAAPRCETHGEPCIQRVTKKRGANAGRAFWACSRPLGPGGSRITNGQAGEWACNYFKWSSDWNGLSTNSS